MGYLHIDNLYEPDMSQMPTYIKYMVEDIKREGEGEIVWSKEVERAIGKHTAILVKQHFQNLIRG